MLGRCGAGVGVREAGALDEVDSAGATEVTTAVATVKPASRSFDFHMLSYSAETG